MKRPNGTGGIRKLSGKRRKPWQAVITSGEYIRDNKIVKKQVSIGTFATKKEALFALANFHANGLNADGRKITFAEVYNQIIDDFTASMQRSIKAIYNYCEPIKNKRMVDLKVEHYQLVMDSIANKSNASKNNLKILFAAINRYCLERDYIIKDYSQFVKINRKIEIPKQNIYTKKEIEIVEKSQDPVQMILLYTGMRISELLNLKTKDISKHGNRLLIHVTKAKTRSGIRIIPVHNKIAQIVSDRLTGTYLIEPHLSYAKQKEFFYEFNKNHGLNHKFHDFRKTFATGLKKCGCDDFYRKALMGHAQENLTDNVYTKATLDKLIESIDKLNYV